LQRAAVRGNRRRVATGDPALRRIRTQVWPRPDLLKDAHDFVAARMGPKLAVGIQVTHARARARTLTRGDIHARARTHA
jgi:hypothetical protein